MLDYDTIKIAPGEEAYFTHHGRASLARMSLGEAAVAMGISRQRAHQLERKAILKLRLALQPLIDERWRKENG